VNVESLEGTFLTSSARDIRIFFSQGKRGEERGIELDLKYHQRDAACFMGAVTLNEKSVGYQTWQHLSGATVQPDIKDRANMAL